MSKEYIEMHMPQNEESASVKSASIEESVSEFKLRKSDIIETVAQVKIYTFTCPYCNKIISTYHKDKTIAYAKLHLARIHGLKVVVE
jgi:hypothetical protein